MRTFARRFRLLHMLLHVNTHRWLAATAVMMLALLAFPAGAVGQPPEETPDAGQVVEAYLTSRQWVNAFATPAMGAAESRLPLDHATGVYVALRRSGRIVGSSVATLADARHHELLIRFAVGRALGQALGDPALAALPEELRLEAGRTLTLEIEVAGPLQPLLGRTLQRLAEQIEPGLDGLALRHGQSVAMAFPAQLRTTNSEGQTATRLPALAVQLNLPPAEVGSLLRQSGVTAMRFRTAHLAQTAPDKLPFETMRGDRVVPESDIDAARIAAFADGIVEHLVGAIWPGSHHFVDHPDGVQPLGLMGDYRPAADVFRPIIAPPIDQALAAFALSEYALLPGVSETDHARRARARDTAERLLRDLEQVASGEDEPLDDPAACAAIVLAALNLSDALQEDRIARLFNGAAARVRDSFIDGRIVEPRTRAALPLHSQAMIAAALARLAALGAGDVPAELAGDAVEAAWSAAPAAEQVALLPWIAWAEAVRAETRHRPIARADALRRLLAALHEVRIDDPEAPADVRGGFALAAPGGEASDARPSAQSTRPAAFVGWALRQPGIITPDERPFAAERHRRTMRFLIQLSYRDNLLWTVRNPGRAAGGVRAALWDHDLPRAAQSMALLAAVETLRSLAENGD